MENIHRMFASESVTAVRPVLHRMAEEYFFV